MKQQDSEELQHAVRLLKREGRVFAWRMAGSLGCWLLTVVSLIVSLRSFTPGHGPNLITLLLCLLSLVGGIAALPRTRKGAIEKLALLQDVRAIGPLIDALDVAPGPKAQQIRDLLIVLLPCLTEADAPLVNRTQRHKFCAALLLGDADRDLPYMLAVLKGLEAIGDEEVLLNMRQLVQRGAFTPGQQCVMEAASVFMASLEARLQRRKVSATLLRAAGPDTTDPSKNGADKLLRPVYSPTDYDIEAPSGLSE